MAFSSTIKGKTVFGNKRVHWGTWTNGSGDTGGDISTGLKRVDMLVLTVKASTSAATAPVINETFPLASGSVTIVCEDNQDGYWLAIGI